ncbi:hypothetical protein SAMN05660860_01845 [Geoalkalibacter ferrihydriticus]|uniref:Helix-turn-helix domain-containing protein n=2 Tax=Geoalkalibacter ferrihydriticus TaxID=392333 RepID=A0A0C2HRK7_9BACT|nr:helix-turn-helix domain-containing protein [Geoalkalibacter ferrihydriticus]KIH77490.1 hypothetical protein GFER_01905 [Geoalkalibacter ferrihydriticus DSM 17813]SDM12352.1 hypothetical protein SAMN05660860_01845 [Geoalkalibacter ferrihydriticus]
MENFKTSTKTIPIQGNDVGTNDSKNMSIIESDFEVITLEEFSKRMKLSKSSIYTQIKKGALVAGKHFFRIGRCYRFIWGKDLLNIFHQESCVKKPGLTPRPTQVAQKIKPFIKLDY